MKEMFSAGVVVYKKVDNTVHYLLLLNAKGHWDFPKGGVEKGETPQEAALRELQEEAGVCATIDDGFQYTLSYFFTDTDGQKAHKTVQFFLAGPKETTITLSHEHTDFAWLKLDNALQKVSFKESKELLQKADEFLRSIQ